MKILNLSEMEKALEILQELLEQSSRKKIIYSKYKHNKEFRQEVDAEIKKYSEAIAELEEAMKPKTCDGCKWEKEIKLIRTKVGEKVDICKLCIRYKNLQDHYEQKE